MLRKQNILETPMISSNQLNTLMKNFLPETTSKTPTSGLFSKIPNRKKISNKQLHFCEAEISLKLCKHFFKEITSYPFRCL